MEKRVNIRVVYSGSFASAAHDKPAIRDFKHIWAVELLTGGLVWLPLELIFTHGIPTVEEVKQKLSSALVGFNRNSSVFDQYSNKAEKVSIK